MLGLFSKTYKSFAFHSPFLGTGKAGFCDVQSPRLTLLLGKIDIRALGKVSRRPLGFGESFHDATLILYAGSVKKNKFLDSPIQYAYRCGMDHPSALEFLAYLIIAGAALTVIMSLGKWWQLAKWILIGIGVLAVIALLVLALMVWQMRRV